MEREQTWRSRQSNTPRQDQERPRSAAHRAAHNLRGVDSPATQDELLSRDAEELEELKHYLPVMVADFFR